MNRENSKMLSELYQSYQSLKFPSCPAHSLPVKKYTDNSANSLTKCVIDFLNMSGFQAERINTTGRYVDNKSTFVDVVGRQRTIGTGKYIKGTGTKGSADISATIWGRSIKIEIKYGKDIQSQSQKEYQQSIEQAGGIYIIVKDFDSFLEWFNEFKNQVK